MDLIVEDLLIWLLLILVSFVFGVSIISVCNWLSLPLLSTIVMVVGSSSIVSMACSSCCSVILSTCNFRLLEPGCFGERVRISYGLPSPIGFGGKKSKLASICSVDVCLAVVLSFFCPLFLTENPVLRLPLCLTRVGTSE